jgi:hypothetical protein
MKFTASVMENGKVVKKEVEVPEDMMWMYVVMMKQSEKLDNLGTIKSVLVFYFVITLLGFILGGCTVLLGI